MILVSFNLASNRPENFTEMCDNLQETAADPTCLEILVKIDDGDEAMHDCVAREQARRPFPIKALSTPGEGYFSLWKSLNRLHRELCDPDAYFVCNINDEIRFKTPQWDVTLRRYMHMFPDDIFRLRTSVFKFCNYVDFWENGYAPENYAFFTKRWIDVAGGDWNACHGPDAYQQFIAYYLSRANYPAKEHYARDVPIWDIDITGEGAFLGLTEEQFWNRWKKGWVAWYIMVSHPMQEEANRRARCLQAFIQAHEALGHVDFRLITDEKRRTVAAYDRHGALLRCPRTRLPIRHSYRLSRARIGLTNWLRRPMQNYYCGGGQHIFWETLLNIPFLAVPWMHPKSNLMRSMRYRLRQPLIRLRPVTAHASNHVPHAPPDLLVDGTPEPWGSAETGDDTYVWLSRAAPFKAHALEVSLFSPGGRAHLADVRVVGRVEREGEAGAWHQIPARIGKSGPYVEKLSVPPLPDGTLLRLELDPRFATAAPFTSIGLACLSESQGDRRNHLSDGRGIYVRGLRVRERPF